MKATTTLRAMIGQDETFVGPGVYDGLSARLVERAGFDLVYASGGAIARSMGFPDLGLISMAEVAARLNLITDSVALPVIADADTGYGNALNTRRAMREFQRAGVAGLHLEDQTFPKRCGHYDDKTVVPTGEMVQKIRAARDALADDDLVLIARTDARAVEGFDRTIERAHAYAEAGADVIFFEAPQSVEEIERIGRELPYPKLINMFQGGKTPLVPVARLRDWGYRLVIIPSDLQRAAQHAMEEALALIKSDGNSAAMSDRLTSFEEREATIGTPEYLELDRRYRA